MSEDEAPTVTVLLPFRDAGATLPEAVESILSQRGPELELLAIDDGSEDGGDAWVEERSRGERRLRLLRARGHGIAAALETGRETARGRFLARMDGDDISLPGRLAAQVDALEAAPRVAALGGRVEAFPEEAIADGLRLYLRWQNSLITPDDHRRELFVESPLCHPSVMMRAEALEQVGGYRSGNFPEDYELWLRLASAGWELAKLPRVLLRWRRHAEQTTFRDPRLGLDRFRAVKALYLAPILRADERPVAIWGAGQTGKRMARALEGEGIRAARFVDVAIKKIGRVARGVPIVAPDALEPGREQIVVAVGARGARARIRAHLDQAGFREAVDYICAS